MSDNTSTIEPSTRELREERTWVIARHDSGALAPAVYAFVKQLEIEIAWREARRAVQ